MEAGKLQPNRSLKQPLTSNIRFGQKYLGNIDTVNTLIGYNRTIAFEKEGSSQEFGMIRIKG